MTQAHATGSAGMGAPPEGPGWVSLFNGRDLSGWRLPEGDNGHWQVVAGVIDYDARSEAPLEKHLWTLEEYGDVELHLEWRLKETPAEYPMPTILPDGSLRKDAAGNVLTENRPNADSGIYLRGTSKAQINIWCWPCGSGEIWGYRNDPTMAPEVRAGCVPRVAADRPVGQWNAFRIRVWGERVHVRLNDRTVIDDVVLPGLPRSGRIALQHHGGFNAKTQTYSGASSLIQFRNIHIRPLR
ncbi:MAG: DUF1080 domain-containing protein [Lentisphaeria bacterium]|nr:DUF1080 domain-containing protein [Lentisphaeria bacterium]